MADEFNRYGLTTKISWNRKVISTPRSNNLYITYACFRNPLKWDFKQYITHTYNDCISKHKECVENLRSRPGVLRVVGKSLWKIISILR